jgi:DNA-binding response OmpR family regulator
VGYTGLALMGDARRLAGRKVLVVEDDPFIAAELHDALALDGARILGPVPSVRAAMAAIEAATPDAAVLDVNLKDASSAPIADALRERAVPVVLVTGYPRGLLDDPGLRDTPILPKPLRPQHLLDLLGDLLSPQQTWPST